MIDRLTFGFHSPSHAAALVCEGAFSYPDFPALAAILERERCRANKKAGQPFAEATGQRFGVGPKALLDAPQAWRCRANTKRHGREIAHRAIEGAQAPPGLDACGIARASSPFGLSRPRWHECAPAVRHESRPSLCRDTKGLRPRLEAPLAWTPRLAQGRRESATNPCAAARPIATWPNQGFERSREAFSCLDERLSRLSCPRHARRSCPSARQAPKGRRGETAARQAVGLETRRRLATASRRNADDAPTASCSAYPKAGASAVRSRRDDPQGRPLSRGESPGRIQASLEMFFSPHLGGSERNRDKLSRKSRDKGVYPIPRLTEFGSFW